MATLHILNKTSARSALNEELSSCMRKGDDVILIEDGCYQLLQVAKRITDEGHWSHKASNIYALEADAHARGIPLPAQATLVDYDGFVTLATLAKSVISWY